MGFGPDPMFSIMFTIIPILVVGGFIFVFGSIIYTGINRAKDRQKPIIPVRARVSAKRTLVWGEHSHTSYYATFELENGERIEFEIPDNHIGYLAEGDEGTLSFQGKIFVDFQRVV